MFQSHKRQKRQNIDGQVNFDDLDITNLETTACQVGEVVHDDYCKSCPAGFFADQERLLCTLCPLDSYSIEPGNQCTACGEGKGTLNVGTAVAEDCKGMFSVLLSLYPCCKETLPYLGSHSCWNIVGNFDLYH